MITNNLQNISHVYNGLIQNDRAFASFKSEELSTIYSDLQQYENECNVILDPMSGYGSTMSYFGKQGYKTVNIEINPPEYYWQLLINPINTKEILTLIDKIQSKNILPRFKEQFSITDNLFSDEAVKKITEFYNNSLTLTTDKQLVIALFLPFVSRFANYQKSKTNITHFKAGGFCSYINWENDFIDYLEIIRKKLSENFEKYKQIEHINILSDIMLVDLPMRYSFFVTSPPYPNYRDYSKLFKIENWVLDNILFDNPTDFNMMIGSNNVSGKKFGEIQSEKASDFLKKLLDKAEKLKAPKSRSDIKTYYYPYFAQYFYNIQEAYKKVNAMLTDSVVGYIVVNDNITRDIIVPVGASICDIFNSLGYESKDIDTTQINHYGNIGKSAKRINSKHTRHIIKVWKNK
jgi:hypothetical protein